MLVLAKPPPVNELVEKGEELLPSVDQIFLSNKVSLETAGKIIKEGETILKKLKRLAKGLEQPDARVLCVIASLEVTIALAKGEVENDE